MKTALKISTVVFAFSCGMVAHAEEAVDGSKLSGVWDCSVSLPTNASGTTTLIKGHASYHSNGTVVHEDTIIQTAVGAPPVEAHLVGLADWSFSKENKQLYETLKSVSLKFDKTNPSAALMGIRLDKSYQAAVGVKQSSSVVRLNDTEWMTLIDNDKVAIVCQRGK